MKQQALLFNLIADFLSVGFSLQKIIPLLATYQPAFSPLSGELETVLASGGLFSAALRPYIGVNAYYQILIAEKHGQLELSLRQLGRFQSLRAQQRKRLHGLLTYPLCLLVLLGLIIYSVNHFLMPHLNDLSPHPPFILSFIQNYLPWILIGFSIIMALYLLKVYVWWTKQGQLTKHHWYSYLPVFGKLYRQYSSYYLSYNLGILLQSGLEINQICLYLSQFESQTLLYQLGHSLQAHLTDGKELDQFIGRYHFIPQELIIFCHKGGTLNALAAELLIYSELSFTRLEQLVTRLVNLIQPLLFLIIAVIIIVVYLSIFGPIYQQIGGVM